MTPEQEQALAKLKALYESGVMERETYETAVSALIGQAFYVDAESGSVAQGAGTTVVGSQGVNVGGDVGGDVITGNVYHGPKTTDPAEALRIYRQVLVAGSSVLPLRGIDVGTSDPAADQNPLRLANVYVDLNTTTRVKRREKDADGRRGKQRIDPDHEEWGTRSLSAMEAATANPRMVLIGDPGSGKSTFVNYLAHSLAAQALDPKVDWLSDYLPGWPQTESDLVPIVVVLRDWAASLPDSLPVPKPQHLWQFIEDRLIQQNLAFAALALRESLEEGRALVLLDGLDEVPTTAQRIFMREAILAFKARYEADGVQRNRYLVTSRVLSYQKVADSGAPDFRLPEEEFPSYELALFNETQIDRFITAWYTELVRRGSVGEEKQKVLANELQEAVRRPDLWRMASNPLLLTIMALVRTHKGRLPDARTLLYAEDFILYWLL